LQEVILNHSVFTPVSCCLPMVGDEYVHIFLEKNAFLNYVLNYYILKRHGRDEHFALHWK